MEISKERLIKGIFTSVFAFIGMWAIVINFVNIFFDEEFYSTGSLLCVIFMLAAVSGILMNIIKKDWLVLLTEISIIGLIVWIKFDAVAGGFAYCVNTVLEQYEIYLHSGILYVDYTKAMLKEYDPALFLYLIMSLLTVITVFCIGRKKLVFIPIILTLAFMFIPVIIEIFASAFAILLTIIYCIMLVVIMVSGNAKGQNKAPVYITAIITGVVVAIITGVVSVIKPEDDFEQNEFFPEFRSDVRVFVTEIIPNIKFWEGKYQQSATIAGGSLGQVDGLSFTGKEVITVSLPAKRDTVYIKGYIGQDYTSTSWKEPDNNDKSLFRTLERNDYTPPGMISVYLDSLADNNRLTGYKGSMKIKSVADINFHTFAPIYPVITDDFSVTFDDAIKEIPKNSYMEYYSVPDEMYKVSTEFMESVMGSELYEYNLMYTEYVYNYYMDVNTTMKDELIATWEKYPVDTAKERFNVAYAIRNYLYNTCSYEIKPGKVPKDKDFVEYFLKETKEGYCTYFATAAVMMFRSAGIPARYVEGYCFNVTGKEEITEYKNIEQYSGYGAEVVTGYCEKAVLDSDAHAWVEFYVDGIGWIDFDVTPGNRLMDSSDEDSKINPEKYKEETEEETTTEEPSESESEEATTKEEGTKDEPTKPSTEEATTTKAHKESETATPVKPQGPGGIKPNSNATKVVLFVILALVTVGLIIMVIIVRYKIVSDRKKKSEPHDSVPDIMAVKVYKRFEDLMKYIKVHREDYMTNMEFAEYIVQSTDLADRDMVMAIVKMQEKSEYAKAELTMEEVNICSEYVQIIRDKIYEQQKGIKKFIFKFILSL